MRFLRSLSIDGFVLALFGTVLVAIVVPVRGEAAQWADVATKVAIAALFLLYGARISPQQALAGLKHWRLHALVLTITFVAFPIMGLALAQLPASVLSPQLATGMLYLTLVPSTVQSSIAFTSIARGNVAAALVSASASNLLGVVLTPLLVVLLMSGRTTGAAGFDGGVALEIVVQLLVPFIVGQLLRRWIGEFVAAHPLLTKTVDRGSILLVVYVAFSAGVVSGIFSSVSVGQLILVVALCCAVLAAALVLSWQSSGAVHFAKADRIVVLFCGSKKSLASGLPMAIVLFAPDEVSLVVLPLMLFHQIQLVVCSIIAARFARSSGEEVPA